MKEAILYRKLDDGSVLCYLCYRLCKIKEGETGFCRVRKNISGKLFSLNYSKAVAYNVDHIEKKPFYHFFPGTRAFSFSTVGCNFACLHCQNWQISRGFNTVYGEDLPPSKIKKIVEDPSISGVAYTYTEPTIFMEYALDTAKLIYPMNKYNVFVTNGYMTEAAIKEMKKYIDASRIDIKSFSADFYREVSGGVNIEYVLSTIKSLYKVMHIELINLIIPTKNDSPEEIRNLSSWVASISKDIPLHFTAFYPAHKLLNLPRTDLETLLKARQIAIDEGLRYVYTGNIPNPPTESTYCPNCGKPVIKRSTFTVYSNLLEDGNRCPFCGYKLNIITDLKKYRSR